MLFFYIIDHLKNNQYWVIYGIFFLKKFDILKCMIIILIKYIIILNS